MKFVKYVLVGVVFLFVSTIANGQQKIEKFQLQNGLIFEGTVQYFNNSIIRILKADGETVEFPIGQIQVLGSQNNDYLYHYNKKWTGLINLGLGFGGIENTAVTGLGMHFGTLLKIHGNENSKLIYHLALKTGIEIFESGDDTHILPLTLGLRIGGSRKKYAPFIFTSVGRGFNLNENTDEWNGFGRYRVEQNGGLRFETGVGIGIKSKNVAYDFSISYIMQNINTYTEWPGFKNTTEEKFKRIFLNFTFHF